MKVTRMHVRYGCRDVRSECHNGDRVRVLLRSLSLPRPHARAYMYPAHRADWPKPKEYIPLVLN